MNTRSTETTDMLLKRLKKDILPVLKKAILENDIFFLNPNVPKCWKALDCKSTECILYGNEFEGLRCWQVPGTKCDEETQGNFMQKHARCGNCRVFIDSLPTMAEEIGEHLNNILFLLYSQKQLVLEQNRQIEQLGQDLASAQKQVNTKNKKIHEAIITDKLTGLFNRHHLVTVFEDELARCRRYGYPLAIMMIGIDKFKSFNDSYGCAAGDRMLAFTGSLIKQNIRKFDRAFRYSDKEFLVILPETDLTLAYIAAERLRNGFKENKFSVRNRSGSKEDASRTISAGIAAVFPYMTNDISTDKMISHAEKALHQAKNKGGNISVRHE